MTITRDLDSGADAAARARVVRLAMLVDLDFSSGPLRLWTGLGELTWAGMVFSGAGALLGLSAIGETVEVRASGVALTLSGVPTEIVDLALQERWQGRRARIWLALFDPDFYTRFEGEPVLVARARMDTLTWTEGRSASFALAIETGLVDLTRPRIRRYTDEDQRGEHPADLGFQFVAGLQDFELRWGRE